MIQCQICQVANEDIAQFCKECGGRLTPTKPLITNPSPLQQAPVQQAPAPAEPQTQPKPKLRSPLFGGGSDADNNFDDDEEVQPSLNKAKGKGLRSPLLGGADEDEEPAFEPKPRDAKSRGALRSPMFGGGDGGKNKEHKSTFPHRSHDVEPEHEPSPAAKLEPGRHQSKGLRSPLLGGDDFDPEVGLAEEPGMQSKAGGQVKAHHRLRSPIFGATDDDYEDEIFDEEVDDVDDPNVLRSPLLAVKTPRAKTVSAQAPAPAPAPIPAPLSVPAPMPVQAIPVQAIPVQAIPVQAMPAQPAPAPYPAVMPQTSPNSPSSPPAAPTSAPQYEPRPAPSPSNSQFGMAAQNPSHYDYGVPSNTPAPAPIPAPAPMPAPMPTPITPQPAPSSNPASDSDTGVKKGLRGSKLLASGGDDDDDELLGPQDRRNKSRERRMSRPDRRSSSSIDVDDDEDVLAPSIRRGSSGAGGGANPMAPLLMAAAAFALIVKVYVFVPLLGNPDLFTKNMPYVLEQVSTMAVLLSLIIFAMKASQKP